MSRATLAVVVALVLAVPAAGGPPGAWTRLPGTVLNLAEPGLVRTADDTLHVVYIRQSGAQDDLMHVTVRPTGAVGQATTGIGSWRSMNNPDLLRMPDGSLRAFFGGIRSTSSGEQNTSMNTATAPAAGRPWTVQEGRVVQSRSAYTGASTGAGLARDGTPISAWASTGEAGFHYGTDPNDPDRRAAQSGCCLYQPEIAVDARTGQAYVGFFSLEPSATGLYAQRISPGGTQGPRWAAPGARVGQKAVNPGSRTALTGRIGAPGVFMAHGQGYPTYSTVALSRVGAPRPQIVVKAARAKSVNVAAAPEGRLWLMWEQEGTIFAARTNRAATKLGATNMVKSPGGGTIFRVSGEGSAGPLDIVANVRSGAQALWHQQVQPKLTVTGARSGSAIVFRVLDAGEAVTGARVRVAGRTLTTAANGSARLASAPPGRVTASASKAGYALGTATIR